MRGKEVSQIPRESKQTWSQRPPSEWTISQRASSNGTDFLCLTCLNNDKWDSTVYGHIGLTL